MLALALAALLSQTPAEVEAPFSGDFTWMNGQSRQKSFPLNFSQHVVLSLYLDTYFALSSNMPKDNTLTGSATTGRVNEFQLNLASVGIDWNYRQVIGRLSLQFGSELNIVQSLDGSVARGRALTVDALRYIREATLGYHFNALHGINVEAGIFMAYLGLESYLTAENWNYTHALVSDHTPYYLQGVRAQFFPTPRLKIEPWLMNGWQTYGKWNFAPSTGLALRWSPTDSLSVFANFYVGTDTRGAPGRVRFNHDHSAVVKVFDAPESRGVSKVAFSLNSHVGFESGGTGLPGPDKAHFLGTALSGRAWLYRDLFAVSARGEVMKNGTAYLAQFPPPGFSAENLVIWGVTGTLEWMPRDFLGLRAEVVWRESNQAYFAGPGGTTSADGFQGTTGPFIPDAVKQQTLFLIAANFRL